MSTLTSRIYTGTADLQAMIALTQMLRVNGQRVYPIAADLFEELAVAEVQTTARLWNDSTGKLVGFVYVNQYRNLVDVFDQKVFTPSVEVEMMAWVESVVRNRGHAQGGTLTLVDAYCLEDDFPRLALLARHGFERLSGDSILMSRPLDQPIPAPALPAGFTIRPMGGEAEIEAYVDLHRAAFGTGNMTVAYRRVIMSAPDYIPELDLVAVAPNGELAAFCVCQIFPDDSPRAGGQKEGWTDPIGTHPAYRQLGLARALMLAGMQRLKDRGIDTALMGTSSDNLAMQHTAESVGFRMAARTLCFSKQLDNPMNEES